MIARVLGLGVRRGGIELRRLSRSGKDWLNYLSNPILFLALAGLNQRLAGLYVAGGLVSTAMMIAVASLPQLVAAENADGTLLRMRGLPYGMAAHVIGKIVFVVVVSLVSCSVILAGAAVISPASLPHVVAEWLTLVWVMVACIAAFGPLGLLVGSVLPNAREAVGLAMIPVIGLLAISGVFFPATAEPRWLRTIADVFPLSWAVQGVHAALTPGRLAPWPAWQGLAVMLCWTVFGTLAAAVAVRALARRQSGSTLTRRRETTAG